MYGCWLFVSHARAPRGARCGLNYWIGDDQSAVAGVPLGEMNGRRNTAFQRLSVYQQKLIIQVSRRRDTRRAPSATANIQPAAGIGTTLADDTAELGKLSTILSIAVAVSDCVNFKEKKLSS